jgi:multimeric flavodoxin WrbA
MRALAGGIEHRGADPGAARRACRARRRHELIRVVDHVVEPGVVSEALTATDEWPALHAKVIAADILIVATPTWLGQQSSVAKRVLERMDALLSETKDDGRPIAYERSRASS